TIARLEAVAPNSLSGRIPRAFLLARDGDRDGALRLCDSLEPVYGKDGAAVYREAIGLLAHFTDEDFLWGGRTPARTAALSARSKAFAARLDRMHRATKDRHWAAWSDFVLMRLPCIQVLTTEQGIHLLRDPQKLEEAMAQPGELPATLARLAAGWPD